MMRFIKRFFFNTELNFFKTCHHVIAGDEHDAINFIKDGVNFKKKNHYVLYCAAQYQRTQVFDFLLSKYKNIKKYNLSQIVHALVIINDISSIKKLMNVGVNIIDVDENNRTPYEEAAQYGYLELLQLFFNYQKPPDDIISFCFYKSARSNKVNIANYLISDYNFKITQDVLDNIKPLTSEEFLETIAVFFEKQQFHEKIHYQLNTKILDNASNDFLFSNTIVKKKKNKI